MTKKLTEKAVRAEFEKFGYVVLGTVRCSRSPLLVECPNGHQSKMRHDHFKRGSRCLACTGKLTKTVDEIRASLKAGGWELLDPAYINSYAPMNVMCPQGHQTTKTWDNWKHGYRCAQCANIIKKTPEEQSAWRKKRYQTIPAVKIRVAIKNSLMRALGGGVKAGRHWEDLIGYSVETLVTHIDSQLKPGWTWENHGSVWHIDHIRPIASFDFSGPDRGAQIRLCWALSNLRPLAKFDNISKGARYETTV